MLLDEYPMWDHCTELYTNKYYDYYYNITVEMHVSQQFYCFKMMNITVHCSEIYENWRLLRTGSVVETRFDYDHRAVTAISITMTTTRGKEMDH